MEDFRLQMSLRSLNYEKEKSINIHGNGMPIRIPYGLWQEKG